MFNKLYNITIFEKLLQVRLNISNKNKRFQPFSKKDLNLMRAIINFFLKKKKGKVNECHKTLVQRIFFKDFYEKIKK